MLLIVVPLSWSAKSVLLKRVSVVLNPISVSVAAGSVRIPDATGSACTSVKPEIDPGSLSAVNPTAAVTTGLEAMGATVETSSVAPLLA